MIRCSPPAGSVNHRFRHIVDIRISHLLQGFILVITYRSRKGTLRKSKLAEGILIIDILYFRSCISTIDHHLQLGHCPDQIDPVFAIGAERQGSVYSATLGYLLVQVNPRHRETLTHRSPQIQVGIQVTQTTHVGLHHPLGTDRFQLGHRHIGNKIKIAGARSQLYGKALFLYPERNILVKVFAHLFARGRVEHQQGQIVHTIFVIRSIRIQ